jgi:multiple sugar transport system substrate-binding protein
MKRLKIISTMLLIVILLVPILQACSKDSTASNSTASNSTASNSPGNDTTRPVVKLSWSTWGNPGEVNRFSEFTEDFNKKHPNIQMTFNPIPNDNYDAKILTELTGGQGPDIFYAKAQMVPKLIDNGSILELGPLANGSTDFSFNDYFEGTWGPTLKDGKYYGVGADGNPPVFWYNKKVLQSAGITVMPSDLFDKNQWTWDAFKDMTQKIKANAAYGYILDNTAFTLYNWITANDGVIFNQSGKFVVGQDQKAVDSIKFLTDGVKRGDFIYSSALPKGQGSDAMFMSNKVGFVTAGRWYLPNFKKVNGLEYDIVPWPSNTGKQWVPTIISGSYVVINKNSKHAKEAFEFLKNYVNKDGQTFRLKDGGNATPSIKDLDAIVLENNLPAHAQYWLDAEKNGSYRLYDNQYTVPGLDQEIANYLDILWLTKKDFNSTLTKFDDGINTLITKSKQK